MTLQNVKITLRIDDLQNWQSINPILNNGELVIVKDTDNIKFKVGNGLSSFNELSYVGQKSITTDFMDAIYMHAQKFSQGIRNEVSSISFAAGTFLKSDANFSQVLGINAQSKANDDYSFVWSGDDTTALGTNSYTSHGKGTFSLNPINGLSGIYIGEKTLADIIPETNIYINSEKTVDLEIINISQNDYYDLVNNNQVLSNAIYIVSSDNLNAYGQKIENVLSGTEDTDGVNLGQVNSLINEKSDKIINSINTLQTNITQLSTKTNTLSSDVKTVKTNISNLTTKVNNIEQTIFESNNKLIQIIKPESDYQLYIEVEISQFADFSEMQYSFNSYDDNGYEYFMIFNSTSWINSDYNGIGPEYNNKPVLINLNLFNIDNSSFIRYRWYYITDNSEHVYSDYYSTVLGASTEVGANSSVNYATKSDIEKLNTQSNSLSSNLINKIDINKENISIITSKIDALSSNAKTITSNIYDLTTKNNQLSNKVNNIEINISNLQTQNELLTDNINILKNTDEKINQKIDSKILIDQISVNQLEIKHVSRDEYYELIANDEELLSNALYIISGDTLNVYNQKIENVLSGTEDTDAVNLGQVNLLINEKIDEITNNINNLQTNINNNQTNITQLSTKNNTLSTNVKTLSSNFSTLSSRSNILSSNIKTLSADLKTIKSSTTSLQNTVQSIESRLDSFLYVSEKIQIIKPESDYPLYIEVEASDWIDFSNISYSINSYDNNEYFKLFNSTTWIDCIENGIGPEYNNKPVLIELPFNKEDSYCIYIRYRWYYLTDNWDDTIGDYEHVYSDYYSTVLGASTEVGANSSVNYATKSDIEKLKQDINKILTHLNLN